MRVTTEPVNIFVLGDLVLDHAIFVRTKTAHYQAVGRERVCDVVRRINTAGGAANCARILASLSYGRTYLWGITGRSPWGAYRDVLEESYTRDAAPIQPRFFGYHTETAKMNTITRIILESRDVREHEYRFDDVGDITLTQNALLDAIASLSQAHLNTPLHAIIINDLDMGTVSQELFREVGAFASQHAIPLFVDPKRTPKYSEASALAFLPNLAEWCEIVGEPDDAQDKWRQRMQHAGGLQELARLSIEHLPNFSYHVIKCDRDGAVIIGPPDQAKHVLTVSRIPPHPPGDRIARHQLGCGDLMTAVLALEYAARDAVPAPLTRLLKAYEVANAVVACYRANPWQRMPTRDEIEQLRTPSPSTHKAPEFCCPERYLPSADIDLTSVQIAGTSLVSVDGQYRAQIEDAIEFFRDGWEDSLESGILTAVGGSGKTELCKAIARILEGQGLTVNFVESNEIGRLTVNAFIRMLQHRSVGPGGPGGTGQLVIIDEAWGRARHLLKGKNGVVLLESGHKLQMRFLFIDADFRRFEKELSVSQFINRCKILQLSPLSDRPSDIPYVFAAGCAAAAARKGVEELHCDVGVLLGVVETALIGRRDNQSARAIFKLGRDAARNALAASSVADGLRIRLNHIERKCPAASRWRKHTETRVIRYRSQP